MASDPWAPWASLVPSYFWPLEEWRDRDRVAVWGQRSSIIDCIPNLLLLYCSMSEHSRVTALVWGFCSPLRGQSSRWKRVQCVAINRIWANSFRFRGRARDLLSCEIWTSLLRFDPTWVGLATTLRFSFGRGRFCRYLGIEKRPVYVCHQYQQIADSDGNSSLENEIG